jgi:phosphoadenosine phosphosulfate reductase
VALIEHDLFRGRVDRVQMAIDRLRMFEPPEGYYLAYSGGKDSDTILALAKMSGVKFDAHFQRSMEPPEVIYHVRKHPEVQIHLPEMTMWQLIRHKRMPPTRLARFCCQYMKERGGTGRVVMTGVRWEESTKRSKRTMTDVCYQDPTKRYFHPIIDWSTQDIWEFLKGYGIEYCKLYNEGFERIGCVLCPYSKPREKVRDMNRFPKIAEAYRRAIIRGWEERSKDLSNGTLRNKNAVEYFASGDEQFDWWISGRSAKEWAAKDTSFWAYE